MLKICTVWRKPLWKFTNAVIHQFVASGRPGVPVALPLIQQAGSTQLGDTIFNEIFHPVAARLIDHCDAVLRVGGPSAGADEMMKQAQLKGKQTYWTLAELAMVPVGSGS